MRVLVLSYTAVAVADRIPPFAAEGAPRVLRTRRRLVALPLAGAYQAQHAVDGGCVEAGGNDLVAGLVLVDVAQQDPVEHVVGRQRVLVRSEEHTSELQSLMRISYAVFCLKKKTKIYNYDENTNLKHEKTHSE